MKGTTWLLLLAGVSTLTAGLNAEDSKSVVRWNFGTEESTPFVPRGNLVRDQAGPRPPEFPDFEPDNTAIQLTGNGARFEIKDTGPQSLYDFTLGDAITLEAWVNVKELGAGQPAYVVGKGRTNSPHFSRDNQNWSLRVVGEKGGVARLGFLFTSVPEGGKPDWHRWTSHAAFEISTGWHHVAVTYEFGRPDSIRGWIDGLPTDGKWDVGGATTKAPVVDDDDVWIGSSMGGSPTNSFRGMLDEVAIHRKCLTDAEIAKRFHRKDGPQVILPAISKMPDLGEIEHGKLLVQLSEGLPAFDRWPDNSEMPDEAERWRGDIFLLPRLPLRYDDWGIRSSWKPPVLLRMVADVDIPEGEHRFLLRARGLARLWIDGKLVAETKPPAATSPNGHDLVTPLAEPPHPGLRVKDYHHQEVFGTATISKKKETSRVVLEVIAGGKNQRTDTGEISVAIESPGRDSFSLLRAAGGADLPLTAARVKPILSKIETALATFDDVNRREASASRDAFWEKRHLIASEWVKQNQAPKPPSEGHPVDAFLNAKIKAALDANAASVAAGEEDTFHKDIHPLLQEKCFRCHGEKDKGGLKLDTREAALHGGDSEIPSLVPGDPAASELIVRLRSDDEDLVMPPTGKPLAEKQIAQIETWIREGADWPAPLVSPEKLTQTPPTTDETFLRRLYLDTIGLPPTPEETREFLGDSSSDKRTRLIDLLLADARYADHQMSDWMDILAENPTLLNPSLNSTGPFRWFLYDSLRDNKALDRMVTELVMMRGDAAYGGSAGFALAAENDAPYAAKSHIVASAFLGIELQCARCHDSPYHQSTQRDLYSLAAMLERKTVTVPATSRVPVTFFEKKERESLIQVTLRPDEPVTPTWPFAAETGVEEAGNLDRLMEQPDDSRERLAALITSPENTRFPQVIVNRLWKRLMGTGFVEPAHDWEGREASHPELLEWLADELLSHDYDLKHITRLIVTSEAYQREANDETLGAAPPGERFFQAPGIRRLTAEQVVDSLHVAVGAAIDSEELTFVYDGSHTLARRQDLGIPRRAWMFTSLNNERDRPSLALPHAQATVDVLEAFGWTGNRQNPIFQRNVDPNVLQPGILANGTLVQAISRASVGSDLARIAVESPTPDELLETLFLRFYGRMPHPSERDAFLPALRKGYPERLVPTDQIVLPENPAPFPLVTWLNHVSPEANTIQVKVEQQVQRGPAPDPRLRSEWREIYEDIIWSLINDREFVWIP